MRQGQPCTLWQSKKSAGSRTHWPRTPRLPAAKDIGTYVSKEQNNCRISSKCFERFNNKNDINAIYKNHAAIVIYQTFTENAVDRIIVKKKCKLDLCSSWMMAILCMYFRARRTYVRIEQKYAGFLLRCFDNKIYNMMDYDNSMDDVLSAVFTN